MTIRVHPSQLLSPGGDKRAAEAAYRNYLAAEPENLMALDGLAFLLQHRGAVGEALQIRRQRYAAEVRRLGVPDEEIDSVVSFLAASLGDGAAPPVPPAAYVEKMFDEFSSIYDRRQVMDLKYRGPARCARPWARHSGTMRKTSTSSIWVAGRDWLERSFGRSPGGKPASICRRQCWHSRAGRGVYDELQQAEIVRFLQETAERFDLIVAADVLNYFGDLSPVFTGIACVLRPGGHCAVTLEVGEGRTTGCGGCGGISTRGNTYSGRPRPQDSRGACSTRWNCAASTASRCGPGEVCGAVRNRRWGKLSPADRGWVILVPG